MQRLSRLLEGYERLSRVLCRPSRSSGLYIPRVGLVASLFSLLERGVVPLLYGPRGAGKTTLLRCLALVLPKLGVRCVYAGLHARPPVVLGDVPPQARGLAEKLGEGRDGAHRGALAAKLAVLLGEGSVLIVDDFDYGLDAEETGRFTRALYESLSMTGGHAHVVLATSEARVALSLHRVLVGNIVPTVFWHMSREEHDSLARLLGYRGDLEELYGVTGGSPDALVSIREHGWRLDEWLEYRVRPRVEDALSELAALGLSLDTLEPDALGARRAARYVLLKYNLLTGLRGYALTRIERGGWIGSRWAWQLPVYARVVEQSLKTPSEGLLARRGR